mmetsp:Transcript_25395/g.34941  ORF Transcript_25395/g.34941 Transcript_25395/m.34941 type:complete len:243 (-) Transcript_25395:1133-1861(-)
MIRKTMPSTAIMAGTIITMRHNQRSFCEPVQSTSSSIVWPFDAKGMKTVLYPNRLNGAKSKIPVPLLLSGVGMRRKSLVVVAVDVYMIAINVSPAEIQRAKSWDPSSSLTLSDVLLADIPSNSDVKVSATIKFMREITQQQLLDAFNEAFKDCGADSVQAFKDTLSKSLGPGNLKKDETITFYWLPKGTLAMFKDDSAIHFLQSPEIARKLLDVYIRRGTSVSPELVDSIESNISRVDTTVV